MRRARRVSPRCHQREGKHKAAEGDMCQKHRTEGDGRWITLGRIHLSTPRFSLRSKKGHQASSGGFISLCLLVRSVERVFTIRQTHTHIFHSDLVLRRGHQLLNTHGACVAPMSTHISLTVACCCCVCVCVCVCACVCVCVRVGDFRLRAALRYIFMTLHTRRHNMTMLIIQPSASRVQRGWWGGGAHIDTDVHKQKE